MQKSQIIETVRMRLGFNQSLSQTHIELAMDAVQVMYEGGDRTYPYPWFLFDKTNTATTVVNQRELNLPTDFLGFYDDVSLEIIYGSSVYELHRDLEVELQRYYSETGLPRYWSMTGKQLNLYPLPDNEYTVRVPCFKKTSKWSALALTDEPNWFQEFPTLVIEETVNYVSLASRDEVAIRYGQAPLGAARKGYFIRVEEMQHTLMRYQVQGSDA